MRFCSPWLPGRTNSESLCGDLSTNQPPAGGTHVEIDGVDRGQAEERGWQEGLLRGSDPHRTSSPTVRSIVVQDRAEAATLGEQRVAAVTEQVQVERLLRFLLRVAVYHDGDSLGGLAGGEGQ